jgi:hypothetical protein
MNEKLMNALGELFIEGSPLYADVKGLMELAIKEERERCAAYVEKNVITSGIHIGPLFNAVGSGREEEHPVWPDSRGIKAVGGGNPPKSYSKPVGKRENLGLPCGNCDACFERLPDLCQKKS